MSRLFLMLALLTLIVAGAAGCSGAPATTPVPEATSSTMFFLDVLAPVNESVLYASSVDVRGHTVSDAVVTVNGQVVAVNGNGTFTTTIALEEGPNVIEVLASDFHGHQDTRVLTVISVR